MSDAGTPLIRAEDRTSSPTPGLASPSAVNDFDDGTRATSPRLQRVVGQFDGVSIHNIQQSVSPPDRGRVELSNLDEPYQFGDRVAMAGGSAAASSSSGGAAARMGRRRSSSSRGGGAMRSLLAGIQRDSNLSHPLLHGGDGGSFVALDVEELQQNRWRNAMPEDVFVHAFSFLTPAELANVSTVSRGWSHAAYEPSLWTHMDLSPLYARVDDAFLIHLLGSQRFVNLKFLSLEGCSAISNKSIKALMHFCPNLRELRLTECSHITNPWLFPEVVKSLPYLRRLELFGCTSEFGIVAPMLASRPKLDLGLFWLEYCAENGIKVDGSGLADCRYQEGGAIDEANVARGGGAAAPAAAAAGGAGQRGCWGRIKGRIIYANNFYHRGGNYPREVIYSCENHAAQDFADVAYHRCQVCERLFPSPFRRSMWTELICKVCFDKENIYNKNNWIPLDVASIRAFSLSDVVSKTIHVASRKNLPVSLRSFGSTPCRLDYVLPEPLEAEMEEDELDEEEQALQAQGRAIGVAAGAWAGAEARHRGLDEDDGQGGEEEEEEKSGLVSRRAPQRIDPSSVPMATFVAINGWRVDEAVHALRAQLRTAHKGLNTRALLVYDSAENVEVLADKRVILDGREGEEHMDLTVQAWHAALEILYPIVVVMILALHFSVLFAKQTRAEYDGKTNYSAYIATNTESSMSAVVVLIIAVVVFVALVIAVALIYRFREQCERCFKRFLVADILAILMFGVATILWLLVTQWRIYLDAVTFCMVIWNVSFAGLMTLYYPMPERLHHFVLIILNAIMAIMLIATLSQWIVVAFLFVAALGDVASELRPNMRLLSPFIIPANVELIYNTPKILYTVGGLRLRAADLLWYGLLTGLAVYAAPASDEYASVLLGGSLVFVCVMASLALMLFVAPFIGCRFRPLPLAIAAAFALVMIQKHVLVPYLNVHNQITNRPVSFK